jgi:protein ImuB
MAAPKAFLKLLELNLNEKSPSAAITKLRLEMEPVKPRITQENLFAPAFPSPEKIELTVARITHFVGAGNIGSPRVLETHRPDGFIMDPFTPVSSPQKDLELTDCQVRFAFRRFRPPQLANVVVNSAPIHITSSVARGEVRTAKGPWFTSGNWWRTDKWRREEWDVALRGGALYRIFRDLKTELWFVEGNYD